MTALRTFRHHRILSMDRRLLQHATTMLSSAVTGRWGHPEAIIGIANGGIEPARQIAQRLAAPLHTVRARHNATDAVHTQATGSVTCHLEPLTTTLDEGGRIGGTVVLVDDIYGTGATFDTVGAALYPVLEPSAALITVALCLNIGATSRPDLWAWRVDDWVRFPWEAEPCARLPIEQLPLPVVNP